MSSDNQIELRNRGGNTIKEVPQYMNFPFESFKRDHIFEKQSEDHEELLPTTDVTCVHRLRQEKHRHIQAIISNGNNRTQKISDNAVEFFAFN